MRASSDPVPTARCERARAWAAVAPDGELAELERRLLAAHFDGCAECARFARDVAAATAELRRAPLRRPARLLFAPAATRRELARRMRPIAAVAAVALVAVGIALRQPLPGASEPPPPVGIQTNDDEAEIQAFRRLRRESLVGAAAYPDRPTNHFGTQPA